MQVSLSAEARDVLKALRQSVDSTMAATRMELPARALEAVPNASRDYLRSIEQSVMPGEDPVAFSRLKLFVEHTSKVGEQLGLHLPETVSLGTVNNQGVNARIVELGQAGSNYLLLFDRGMLLTIDLLAEFIAATADRHNITISQLRRGDAPVELERAEMAQLDEIVVHLISKVSYHVRHEEGGIGLVILDSHRLVSQPATGLSSDRAMAIWTLLDVAMITFVVAHELVHLHQRYSRTATDDVFAEELKSDIDGGRLAWVAAAHAFHDAGKKDWAEYALSSGPLLLSCLSLLERASFTVTRGPVPPVLARVDRVNILDNRIGSYPTALFRRAVVQGALSDSMSRPATVPAASLCVDDWVMMLFESFWTNYEAEYLKRWEKEHEMSRVAEWLMSKGKLPPEYDEAQVTVKDGVRYLDIPEWPPRRKQSD